MSMMAHTRTDSRGNITIYLDGGLSFENISIFQKKLELLLKSNPGSIIILDLYKLDFVGSSGIGFFRGNHQKHLPTIPSFQNK